MSGVSSNFQSLATRSALPSYSTVESAPGCKKWDAQMIASHLWQDPITIISDDIVEKVNLVSPYLESLGYELEGVKSDGDCFFTAFLKSYRNLTREIPLLDENSDKISFLRESVSTELRGSPREKPVREKGLWVDLDEGALLAKALTIPIRVVTVNGGLRNASVNDMLVFPQPGRPNENWETIPEAEKPDEFVFLADLGGHFIYAKKIGQTLDINAPSPYVEGAGIIPSSTSKDCAKRKNNPSLSTQGNNSLKRIKSVHVEKEEKAPPITFQETLLTSAWISYSKKLDFSKQMLTDEDVKSIVIPELLKHGKNLRCMFVDLRFNQITALGVSLLAELKYLVNLNISFNPIGDKGAVILASSTTLRKLEANSCGIGIDGANAFLLNSSIEEGLCLYGNEFFSSAWEWGEKINQQLENNKVRNNPQFAQAFLAQKKHEEFEEQIRRAIEEEKVDLLRTLVTNLKKGANTRFKYGCNLLTYAIGQKSAVSAEALLKMGAFLEHHEREYTFLFTAAETGNLPLVKLLLQYGANIRGEFYFNRETALSISAFKFCEEFQKFLKKTSSRYQLTAEMQEQAQKMIKSWEILRNRGAASLEAFSEKDPMNFAIDCLSFFKSYKEDPTYQNDENSPDDEKVSILAEVFELIKTKFECIQEKAPSTEEDGYCTDEDRDLKLVHRIEMAVKPSDQFQDLTLDQLQAHIDRLNQELKQGKKETSIDWSTYPRFFIAQFRGIHYYRHHFSKRQRADHRSTYHLNRLALAPAAYFMSSLTPKEHQIARESVMRSNAEIISDTFEELAGSEKVAQYWGNKKRIFENPNDMLQQRMSSSYDGYMQEIADPEDPATQLLSDRGINKGYPHYATSDLPMHALRYSYGQKPITGLKEWRLRPVFQESGKASHPYPGKIYITMFTPLQMHLHRTRHVAGLHNRQNIQLPSTVAPERETSIPGKVEPEISIYEELLVIPSFEQYDASYEEKYGISESKFQEYKNDISLSLTHPDENERNRIRKRVKNAIIDSIIEHKERQLLKFALEEAKRLGGYLIFRHFDGEYGMEFEKMRTPQKREKYSYTIREKQLLDFLRSERSI